MPRFTPNNIVCILTDFGNKDPYVAVMKAVILQKNPMTRIIDLSNEIPPQDIYHAAFFLRRTFKYFPKGTIFLCVVDPFVGSPDQQAVALLSMDQLFIGPDNGLFTFVNQKDYKCWKLQIPTDASTTFHGRDVYAMTVAKILGGTPIESLGKETRLKRIFNVEPPKLEEDWVIATVVYADHFGNLITNLNKDYTNKDPLFVEIGGIKIPFVKTYSDVQIGSPLALWGSFGELEVSIRNGNAKEFFGLTIGSQVRVKL